MWTARAPTLRRGAAPTAIAWGMIYERLKRRILLLWFYRVQTGWDGEPQPPVTPVQLEDFQTRFAKVLRRRRLLAQLNQEELAEKAQLHRTHVSVLERKRQVPSMTAVLKIAAALGVTLTELFREVESDEEPEAEPPEIPKGRPPKEQPKEHKGRGGREKGTKRK
jgi:transcriptional regulator with XRE-family HTH domain